MEEKTQDLKIIIGKNIAEYRKLFGMSQIEFAEKLNYSDKAISKWERGESLPDIVVLKNIADLFGITLNDLAGYVSKKNLRQSLKKLLKNKILAMLITVGLVWLTSTAVFVFFKIFNFLPDYAWLSFIYAVPVSFLICIIYTAIFFRNRTPVLLGIFESLFVWTSALSVCFSVNFDNIWLILFIAIPIQVLIILVNLFNKKKKIQTTLNA